VYEGRVELLPITKEKYISFTKNVESTEDERKENNIKLRFINSKNYSSQVWINWRLSVKINY